MQNIIKLIAATAFTIAILVGIGFAFEGAMAGQEQFECQTWQTQAKTFSGFYLTKWQAKQCAHWKIKIEAPVQ